jgi:lipopolysaccharide transport system ATP-binding protein
MSEVVIQAERLSKMYRLGVINNGTLFRDIQTWIALKRGKEDPHSKIGENKYDNNEDHFWALKDLDLDIKQGDRVGIIGKNGAGKSTLLKILSRITAPTEGTIKIKGKISSLLEVGTGFHGELTGRENIYLNGAILGMKKRRISEKMDEIVAFSGIEHHIDTPVKRYSSGMYVRLAFAVAAHLDSDILIADEVLAVGDAEFQKKALGKMQDLSTGQGRTVLFVSHNMAAVKNLCNCGIALEGGRIRLSSDDIENLVATYLNNFDQYAYKVKWVNNGEFEDPDFTPLCLELQEEDGSPVLTGISADKNYQLKLTFKIERIDHNLELRLIFSDTNGNLLFSTGPWGMDSKPEIGINTVFCFLPKNTFNIQKYIVSLGSFIQNIRWINKPEEYSVSIIMNVIKKDTLNVTANSIIAPSVRWYR